MRKCTVTKHFSLHPCSWSENCQDKHLLRLIADKCEIKSLLSQNQLPSLSKRRDAIKALSITQNVTSVYCSCFTQKELYLVSYTSCCYGTLTFGEGKHAWEILGEEDTGRKRNVSVVEPGCGKRCGMGFWGFGVSTARINCWKNCAVLRKKKNHVRREKKKIILSATRSPLRFSSENFIPGSIR